MLGWLKKRRAAPHAELREMLFGDLPPDKWPASDESDVEPWASFVRARQAARADAAEAIRVLRSILAAKGLESRHYLQAWTALRQLGVRPEGAAAKEVLGVVVEVPVDGGLDVLAAYADHSARYLNHGGRAVIWERPDARLDANIDALLRAGSVIVARIGPWEGPRPPPPRRGEARLNMLTPSGLHFGQGAFEALARDPMAAPAFSAATGLMQKLIALTPPARVPEGGE